MKASSSSEFQERALGYLQPAGCHIPACAEWDQGEQTHLRKHVHEPSRQTGKGPLQRLAGAAARPACDRTVFKGRLCKGAHLPLPIALPCVAAACRSFTMANGMQRLMFDHQGPTLQR